MTDDLVKMARERANAGGYYSEKWDMLADRIETLEAALRTVKEWHGYGLPLETTRIIDAALEDRK